MVGGAPWRRIVVAIQRVWSLHMRRRPTEGVGRDEVFGRVVRDVQALGARDPERTGHLLKRLRMGLGKSITQRASDDD